MASADAILSACGTYRYRLSRHWPLGTGTALFIMLNPSTADASQDDPTIRKCTNYARAWGFARLEVVNLFAYRATRPADLRAALDSAVGPDNDDHIRAATRSADLVVAAWGAWKFAEPRAREVRRIVEPIAMLHYLALSKSGAPCHPLYLRNNLKPTPL